MQLLVTMSIPRPEVPTEDVGGRFVGARLEILDWERKERVKAIEYKAPPENLGEGCCLKFTGGAPYQGKWFQTSNTEVVVYNVDDWSVERVISLPSFHDLHGCAIIDNEIAVVNTGLEMIQFLDMEGNLKREVNVAQTPTWERFDRDVDYRCVLSTKPHEVHPNHVFKIDGQWWVTRLNSRDAVCLENPEDRIDIRVGQPHDGIIRGDFIYFTTTNGYLVVVDIRTRKVVEAIDLNRFTNRPGGRIGWCRGLEVDGDFAYVSFSRLRTTKWREAYHWAKDLARGRKRKSHIEKIDLKRVELVDSYDYEEHSSSGLFTLMNYDRVQGKLPPA